MEVVHVVSCIIFLLTVTASPEIPSKGKHGHIGDKSQTSVEDADMPRFAEPVANVTVSVGRDALLACVVENLKGYKVAWVRIDTQTILSIHHNVISQNNRISLTYNDHRSWYLHIKEVEESDRGWYMCQVNTDPMRSRKGYLQVVVPPMIVEGMTSNDLVVREGLNVTLVCKARGYPEPYVMWRREDGEEMLIGGEHVNVVDGELLHITKVSRLHMAAYLCVASNGVPPSISKRVHLRVQFPPMLSIPNQLEGAYLGQDVILECHTEAYPASINYWTTERGDMIISDTSRAGDKYETTSTVNGYTKYMKLKIRNVGPNDFGTYRCVAKNSLGETDGNIKLDEMPAPTTAILSEMAMLNRSLGTMFSRKNGKRRNKNKLDSNSLPDYGVEEWRDGAGNAGDNNQAPMRNPPDAFHNSAGTLAQHNLVGIIIQAIKMQSFGIFQRLKNYIQTINERVTEVRATEKIAAMKTAETTKTFTSTAVTAVIRKIIQNYVYKIQKTVLGQRVRHIVSCIVKMIKSTVFIIKKQQQEQQQQQQNKIKNHIIENEFKTFKHSDTQETHVNNEQHCEMCATKLYSTYCFDKNISEIKHHVKYTKKIYKKNLEQLRAKKQKVFYKINKTLQTNINMCTVVHFFIWKNNMFHSNKHVIFLYCFSLIIISYFTHLTFTLIRFLFKSLVLTLIHLNFNTIITTLHSNHLIFLQHCLFTNKYFIHLHANNILWHIVINIFSMVVGANVISHLPSSISLYLNLTPSSSSSSILLSTSSSSLCLTLLFCR